MRMIMMIIMITPEKAKKKKTDPKAYKPKWGFDSATIWKIFGEDGSKWDFFGTWVKGEPMMA